MKNTEKNISKIEKKEIRRAALAARERLAPKEREKAAVLLTERILGHQWFYRAEELLGFVSYGSEIDTTGILLEALRLGKKVYVPKVCGTEGSQEMRFYRIQSLEELRQGYRGIREPAGDTECYCYTGERAEKTLMLMPGAAFDSCRNRVGYGKGFYDRYLSGKEGLQVHTIAVGFRCQLVEEIPAESTDIRPYQIICM